MYILFGLKKRGFTSKEEYDKLLSMTTKEKLAYKIEIGSEYSGAKVIRELPISYTKSNVPRRTFECLCKCGATFTISLDSLIKPTFHSCVNCQYERARKPIDSFQCKYPRLWAIYHGMIYRCLKAHPKTAVWKNYRGRGITVCKEWQDSFMSFVEWALSHGYDSNLSIDRINVNGNYEPSNCRWADVKTQAKNKRPRKSLFNVEIDGQILNLTTVSEIYHIPYSRLLYRYTRGVRGSLLVNETYKLHKGRSHGNF